MLSGPQVIPEPLYKQTKGQKGTQKNIPELSEYRGASMRNEYGSIIL